MDATQDFRYFKYLYTEAIIENIKHPVLLSVNGSTGDVILLQFLPRTGEKLYICGKYYGVLDVIHHDWKLPDDNSDEYSTILVVERLSDNAQKLTGDTYKIH